MSVLRSRQSCGPRRVTLAAADVDANLAPVGQVRRQEREGDAAFEHRREVAARHLAGLLAVDEHRASLARHLTAVDHQAAQPARDTALLLAEQRGAPSEV